MVATRTEQRTPACRRAGHPAAGDHSPFLAEAQVEAASVVASRHRFHRQGRRASPRETLAGGGRLAYAAAGSSGLMALADALELPGTFGIARDRIAILLAGGAADLLDACRRRRGRRDAGRARRRRRRHRQGRLPDRAVGQRHHALCRRGARGSQGARGAATIGIANNDGAPLLALADVAILLPTPPELIAGSTRMGAGTAQKIALNMMSTLMAIHLGHVHDGYMVNLIADNIKLQRPRRAHRRRHLRAQRRGCRAALEASGGAVKPAILLAAGAADARRRDAACSKAPTRSLRPALAKLGRERTLLADWEPETATIQQGELEK